MQALPGNPSNRSDKLLLRTDTPHNFPSRTPNSRVRAITEPALAAAYSGDCIFSASPSSDVQESISSPSILSSDKSTDTLPSESESSKAAQKVDSIAAHLWLDIQQKKRTSEKRELLTLQLKKDPKQTIKDLKQLESYLISTSDKSSDEIALMSSYLTRKLDSHSRQVLAIQIFHTEKDEFSSIDQFHRITGTILQQFISKVQSKHIEPFFRKTVSEIRRDYPKDKSMDRTAQLIYASQVAYETLKSLPDIFDSQNLTPKTKAFYKAFYGAIESKFPGKGKFLTIQMVVLRFLCPSLVNAKRKVSILLSASIQSEYNKMLDRLDDPWFMFTNRLLDLPANHVPSHNLLSQKITDQPVDQINPSESLSESDDKVGR